MSNNLVPRIDTSELDSKTRGIAQKILDEEDVDRIKDLTNLFNLNSQKRNVMRVLKMNELLDTVTDKIVSRFEKTPDNFSNEDLIKFMQVTEQSIEKANKNLQLVEETPAIQMMQNNQVNINIGSGLDKDSRDKVFDTVKSILNSTAIKETEKTEEDDYE